MNSYEPASVEDHRTIRGNGRGCVTNFEAIGLHARMFIILTVVLFYCSGISGTHVMVFLHHQKIPHAELTPACLRCRLAAANDIPTDRAFPSRARPRKSREP